MNIVIEPIAYISNRIKERRDDNWKNIISVIKLNDNTPTSAIAGLEDFSHLEVIFYFNRIEKSEIHFGSHNPRNNTNYHKVGIFAQRASKRPNLIGSTIVKLIEIKNRNIKVHGLDAIDGSPVLDLKPVMKELLPSKDEVFQPRWSLDLMKNYWQQ